VTESRAAHGQEWCSLRLRFDERELVLLRGAEHVRGADLATHAKPVGLRSALTLAKAGHKLRAASPGASLTFEETEVRLLVEAAQFAVEEVRWAASHRDVQTLPPRGKVVLEAFPELVERGLWRSFSLTRDLGELAVKLERAISA
jgi:hypothetical protein